MSWIFITTLVALFMVIGAILSSYARGYKAGYRDGYEECKLLGDVEVETYSKEGEHERVS